MTDDVLLVFAETIVHLIGARERLSGQASRSYNELISLAIRKVDEVAPVNVSKAAHDKARELRLEKDLRQYCWFCQRQKPIGVCPNEVMAGEPFGQTSS